MEGSDLREGLLQVEGSNQRWRGAIRCVGERSNLEGSYCRWRGAIAGEGERSQVKGSDQMWRGALLLRLLCQAVSVPSLSHSGKRWSDYKWQWGPDSSI